MTAPQASPVTQGQAPVHPSQAHWPDDHSEVVKCAVRALDGVWPAQLESGSMFYMGHRVTRAEFKAAAKEQA